jgi:hypothetical protein
LPANTGAAEPNELPELERTTVHLPWDAFKELLQLPKAADVEPKPPRPFVVKRAAYQGTVKGDHAAFTATFEVEVLTDSWVKVPLLPADGVALQAARIDQKAVALAVEEEQYLLCIQGKGTYTVALDFQAPLVDPDVEESGIELALVEVPVSVLSLDGPAGDWELTVEPAFGLIQQSDKTATRVSAALGGTSSASIQWRPRSRVAETPLMPLVATDSAITGTFADRVLTLQAIVKLSVQKAPIASLCVQLPDGMNFLAAEGDVVREWEPEGKADEPTGRRARIHFQYDLKGDFSLVLRAELPFGEAETVTVPPLLFAWDKAEHQARVEGKPSPKEKPPPELVDRQKGVVALGSEPRTEIKVSRTQNLVPLDVKELPRTLLSAPYPPLVALRYARVPTVLQVGITAHDDLAVLVATIDHAHLETIALEDGRVLTKAFLNLRNNARQFLKVKLPPGAALWSSFRSGQPVKPATDAEGNLRVPLEKAGEGAPFTVELAWLQESGAFGTGGARELVLPRFDLPSSYMSMQLYLPRRYRHYNFDGGLKRVEILARSYSPLFSYAIDPNMMMNAVAQTIAPPPRAVSSGPSPGEGSAGQLPIRIPMLKRGLEALFERTLVVDEPVSVKWECKRRKSDAF